MKELLGGRSNRALYWVLIGVCFALYLGLAFAGLKAPVNEVVLAIVCIPRLHDIGRSGWWFLLVVFAALFGGIGAALWVPPEWAELALAGTNVAVLVFIAVLGAIPGQTSDNHFGPPPPPGLPTKSKSKR